MRVVAAALATAVRAPVKHWRLAATLWLARVLPIAAVFSVQAYDKVAARTEHHPDAGLLMDPAADGNGWVYAWTSDFFRIAWPEVGDTIFWLIVFAWLVVTPLAGGITSAFLWGRGDGLLAESGRYAGRFLRLALLVAVVFYWMDFAANSLLAEAHQQQARIHHLQDFAIDKQWIRGTLFLALVYVVGLVHSYARIDIVAHDRRSACLSFLRGFGTLFSRLGKLAILETGLLALAGLAALLMWLALKGYPLHPGASWLAVGVFVPLALATSYLRTGIEVGALGARCRLIVPSPEPLPDASDPGRIASQIEAALTPLGAEPPLEDPDEPFDLPPPRPENETP